MNNTNKWLKEVAGLLGKLSAAGQPGICTFQQGKIDGCEARDFDDSGWKNVMGKGAPIPGIATDTVATEKQQVKLDLCDWSMVDGSAAMRKKICLPETIEGVATAGSKILVTMTMLAPLSIYIDGKEAASYRYWGDTRLCELVVTESYQPGDTHTVVFKTPENDGDAHLGVCFNYEAVEQAMLDLTTAVEQIAFARRLQRLHGAAVSSVLAKLDSMLDVDAVASRNWQAIRQCLQQIDSTLAELDSYAKEFKIHIVSHSHLDMNWLWDYEDTVDICVRDFSTICDIMDENPDLRFSQSQTCVYDIVQKNDPATFQRVLKKIREGSWEVTAATWSEHDFNTSGGEVFAHQLLTAAEYVQNTLKAPKSRVCWEPDTFGFPATVPNILARAGVEYFYHFRCGTGHALNWWEGTDGSRVLDFCFGPYNNALRPNNMMPVAYTLFDKYGMKNSMFVFGVGDHGGGPTRNDIRIKRYLDGKHCLPQLVFSKVQDFFDEALQEKCDYPVHKGEMNFIFEGCYSTKSKIKKYLRHGENSLLDAEAVLALEKLGGTDVSKPYGDVMRAWEKLSFLGFHDISCGCNIRQADVHDYALGQEVIATAQAVQPQVQADETAITVLNQLGFERDELVCVDAPKGLGESGCLEDAMGQHLPYQVVDGKLYFIAFDLPAFSTAVYRPVKEHEHHEEAIAVTMREGTEDGSVCTVETTRFLLELSARSGTITTLYDKTAKRHVLQHLEGEPEVRIAYRGERSSNSLMMTYEEPHIMSAWMIGNIERTQNLLRADSIELVANGPVLAKLRVTKHVNETKIQQFITVYENLDRIDFDIDIDWQEMGHYKTGVPMLKVGLAADMSAPSYTYGMPMGSIGRNIHGQELPGYRYVAMHEEGRSLALLNDCKFGFYAQGNLLYTTMVRGSYSPDAQPDKGQVTASYAIVPYYGEKNRAQMTNDAASFNQKPLAYHGTTAMEGAEESNLFVEDENVVVTCIKPSSNGKGIVVRLLETDGINTETNVFLNAEIAMAYEMDLTEKILRPLPLQQCATRITLAAHENRTIYFELA